MRRTIAVTAVAVLAAGLLTACGKDRPKEECRASGDELVLVATERGGGGRGGSTGGSGHRGGHRSGVHAPAPHDDCDDD